MKIPFIRDDNFLDNSPEEMAAFMLHCQNRRLLAFPPLWFREWSCGQVNHCVALFLLKNLPSGEHPTGKHTFEPGVSRCLDCGIHRDEVIVPAEKTERFRWCMGKYVSHQYNALGLCTHCNQPRKRNLAAHRAQNDSGK